MLLKKIILAGALLATCAASAEELRCKVIGVADGDTITCLTPDKRQAKVRLAQIDAPEKAQPYGDKSRQSLAGMVHGRDVLLTISITDKYGRSVATVWLDGRDINLAQVQAGMAWVYTQYAHDPAYTAAERAARAARAGLWADASPVAPWQFRRGSAAAQSAQCGSKRTCNQMASCDEAMHYLSVCGVTKLDRNGDGVPCESMCKK